MDSVTLVLIEVSSFGQYIYGVYLGFNGEILLEVGSAHDLGLLTLQKPYLFSFARSCSSPRCCLCLQATSSRCLGSTSQGIFWRHILVHNNSLQQVNRTWRRQSALSEFEVCDRFGKSPIILLAASGAFSVLPPPSPCNRPDAPNLGPCLLPDPTLKRLSARFKNGV